MKDSQKIALFNEFIEECGLIPSLESFLSSKGLVLSDISTNDPPVAFLTKENCFFKRDHSFDGLPRFKPNPNADGSYSMQHCFDQGYIPVYNVELMNQFDNL